MFDPWGSRFKTFLAALPVTAIVAYLFVSRRRRAALCGGDCEDSEAAQARAERATSNACEESSPKGDRVVETRRHEGVGRAPKKSEDDKQLTARPQLNWSYSAGGAPVLLGPTGTADQRKVMSPNEKREMDLMLKYQGRGRSAAVPLGSFEQAKAKKARQTQRKQKEACAGTNVETAEVDVSFQKMANELSVVELEAMILETKTGAKVKKAKKPKTRKKKAAEPEVTEVTNEAPLAPEEAEAVEVQAFEESLEEKVEDEVASPITASPAPDLGPAQPASDEEPMSQVRSRRTLRKRRRKALQEAEAEKAAREAAARAAAAALEAAVADEEANLKDAEEIVSEDAQDTTLAEDEPSEDTRDAADDASSSDAKEPKATEEEVKEEKIIDSAQDFGGVKCTSAATQGAWHRTQFTTRKKWADLVDSDDERA